MTWLSLHFNELPTTIQCLLNYCIATGYFSKTKMAGNELSICYFANWKDSSFLRKKRISTQLIIQSNAILFMIEVYVAESSCRRGRRGIRKWDTLAINERDVGRKPTHKRKHSSWWKPSVNRPRENVYTQEYIRRVLYFSHFWTAVIFVIHIAAVLLSLTTKI